MIIIGQDPLPLKQDNQLKANGLSFSTNCWERELCGQSGKPGCSIWTVHKAMKEASILEEEKKYDCSHEDWARNKIILINTALTGGGLGGDQRIMWVPFTQKLLAIFVANMLEREREDPIYLIFWGSFAKDNISTYIKKYITKGNDTKFIVSTVVHPYSCSGKKREICYRNKKTF